MLRHPDSISSARRMSMRLGRAALLLPAFFAVACVTVNIYFPAPEVRQAAEEIVDETWGSGAAPAVGPQSAVSNRLLPVVAALFSPREAAAADVDVNVTTAAIRALKDAMKRRSAELKPWLSKGNVGIDKNGMLVERDATGLDLATKAKVRRLIDAENKDRDALYREIAAANKFAADRLADIRTIFAQTWKEKAEPGWWIQDASGAWKTR